MKQNLLTFLLCGILLIGVSYAQNRQVSGKVTSSSDGSGLSGVSVQLKGADRGVQSDENGEFVIEAPSDGSLIFTYVGFESQTVSIQNRSVINVVLQSAFENIEEVTIQIPYGTIKRTSFTGSESTVSSKTFEQQRVTSFTRALEGAVPGLSATNGGGLPGTNANIQIRGVGSVNASSSPLYVLDGVPYSGANIALNTDDIESVTVLKDASATSLYGSRAANGVIMITTKKGRNHSPEVNANIRTGFQNRFIPEYDRINSEQYYELMWEATRNRYVAAGDSEDVANQKASDQLIAGLVYNTTNVPNNQVVLPNGKFNPEARILYQDSWEDALFQSPFKQDYNVNIRGGSNSGNYYISLGYVDEPGITKFSGYERFTGRVNADANVKDWLKTGLSIDGALGEQNNFTTTSTATSNPFYYTRMMGPIYPVWFRDEQGNKVVDPVTGEDMLDWGVPSQYGTRPYAGNSNLLGSLALDERSRLSGNINANTYLEAKFLEEFTFRTSVGGTYYNNYRTDFQNSLYGDADNVKGRSYKINDRQLSFTFNQTLTWERQLDEDNYLNILVGHENYRFSSDYLEAARSGFPFPGTSELAPAATAEGSTSYKHNHRIESFFSRLMYDYQDKYLFSASLRRDGTSRFHKDARWGSFYSVGGAWRLSQEEFLQDSQWINELKLKASYGETGNESLIFSDGTPNYYAWQSLYALGNNNVNSPGAIISSLPNQELAWEKNSQTNIGLDFAFLNNRIQGSIDWYNRQSSNLLFQVPLPMSTGITFINKNIGTMYNRGIDFQIGYNAVIKDDFDWRIDLNLSHFTNKITELAEENREDGIISGSKKLVEGKDIYQFWLREYAGVDTETGRALFYKDVTDEEGNVTGRETTGNITEGDYYFQGSAIPDLNGGLQNYFRFKNVDLSFLLTFQLGGKFYDSNYLSLMHPGTYGSHWHADILDRWQKPGDITDVPKIQNDITEQQGASTRGLFDASYLNIRNISLGYNLPNDVVSKIGLKNARIFGSIDNVHFFSKRKGMDPQRSFTGTADFTYPAVRTFTFGLSVGIQ